MKRFGLAFGIVVAGWAALAMPVRAEILLGDSEMGRAQERARGGVMGFTTYDKEKQAILNGVPCKWVTGGGRLGPSYGGGRYDFLCKGGIFGTVSLFLDKGGVDGVGGVRLLYTEWRNNVHPNAAEAFVAQQFLQHVTDRFVPGDVAKDVLTAFWQETARTWGNAGVKVRYAWEDDARRAYAVRRLEISGKNMVRSEEKAPVKVVGSEVPTGVLRDAARMPAEVLREASPTLVKADLRELQTAPAPESLVKPVVPPEISASLVPDPAVMIDGRAKAPSNFESYNRAVELTKDVELKAATNVRKDKIVRQAQGTLSAGKPIAAPNLPKVETPAVMGAVTPTSLASATVVPPTPPTAGLTMEGAANPAFTPSRPLPQLRFIPKAEPLVGPDEVIRFEDEGSKL